LFNDFLVSFANARDVFILAVSASDEVRKDC